METIGEAFAGHSFRVSGHRKAEKYDNMMTFLVNRVIDEAKAKANAAANRNATASRVCDN